MTTIHQDVRAAAGAIVADVAERLADPATVAALMRPHADRWFALSLGDGYPAVALLHAELGRVDSGHRRIAHRFLAAGAGAMTVTSPTSLYHGYAALAFAASRAARRPDEYAGVLTPLDERIAASVPTVLRPEWQRIKAGRAGCGFHTYDVPSGMTGLGRYLLARYLRGRAEPTRPALVAILEYLTALSRPAGGLPGWWVDHAPDESTADPPGTGAGHANLGLAHGAPGPLALLALAWRAGVRVPGQDDAIARIAEWLLDWSDRDDTGPYWPDVLSRADLRDRPYRLTRARTAWCYGVPGIARALQLAGAAIGHEAWTAAGVAAAEATVDAVLAELDPSAAVTDPGLCHGWAGLLHVTRLIGHDAGALRLARAAGRLARRVVECYDPSAPFGFRVDDPRTGAALDLAGFLEGAAGTALALHSYVTGRPPTSGWDAALLVS